ncbi:1-acyl-sn-glycerol-3-phosphate acyltransferase delta-like [Branchiostoma floridae]|uniref:1-acyl-sn-glycerol-3-phosphate acyltransferase delta-like n=1 Tax=Branchiostoma floridae TaxID=7739 RepID=A0A9J7NAJ1_BRAFL|nr:1-acyl-sn-glycerol-3-phosphate acyltransferase delta-like [Branchiostoma floridae]
MGLASSLTNVVAYIFMTYVILVTAVISNVFQIVAYLLMRPFSLTVYRNVVSFCQYLILSQLSFRFDWWGQSEITFYISDADRPFFGKETAVIVMNHRNSAEHLFCFAIAERLGLLRTFKAFCADYIKYIPTAGWSLFFNECIFLKRSYEKDRGLIVKQLEELQTYPGIFWLLFYCEGTRFTAERYQTSMEVARSKGLPELKHHLLPRTKGFTLCARVGRKYIQAFYDLEYHFDNGRPEPTMMDLLKGKAHHVHVYFRRIPMEEIPEDEEACAKYCHELYRIKVL